ERTGTVKPRGGIDPLDESTYRSLFGVKSQRHYFGTKGMEPTRPVTFRLVEIAQKALEHLNFPSMVTPLKDDPSTWEEFFHKAADAITERQTDDPPSEDTPLETQSNEITNLLAGHGHVAIVGSSSNSVVQEVAKKARSDNWRVLEYEATKW